MAAHPGRRRPPVGERARGRRVERLRIDGAVGRCHTPPAPSTAQRYRRPLLLAVIAAQLADLLTFIPAVDVTGSGPSRTRSPARLFALMGPMGPAAFKVIAVVVLVLLVRRMAIWFPALALPTATLAIALGLLGMASNVVVGLL